jgi:hypothetical protein
MFEPLVTARTDAAQLLSEGVATFGLIAVMIAVGRMRAAPTPFTLAACIVAYSCHRHRYHPFFL